MYIRRLKPMPMYDNIQTWLERRCNMCDVHWTNKRNTLIAGQHIALERAYERWGSTYLNAEKRTIFSQWNIRVSLKSLGVCNMLTKFDMVCVVLSWKLTWIVSPNTFKVYDQHITMTSYWPRWRLNSPASRLFTQAFIQVQIKENTKASCHWPLCGVFTGDRWIPRTKGQ